MDNRNQKIDSFFQQYAARTNKAINGEDIDVAEAVNCFALCFVEASPSGIICGNNDADFKKKIPEGFAFYRKLGITAMNILSSQISLLDDLHAMAKIHWSAVYKREKDNRSGTINFDVIYLLQLRNDSCKIFAYITGDEQQALKEAGLR